MFESGEKECVEFPVDIMGGKPNQKYDALGEELGKEGGWYSVRFEQAARMPSEYSQKPEVCKCHQPVYYIGQDESIYKAFARERNEWIITGVRALRNKTERPWEMVSAFQDEQRGFSIPLLADDLVTANALRSHAGRPDLVKTPGTRFLVHGKNKEEFWGYAQFEEQIVDVMDVFEALDPGYQLMISTPWTIEKGPCDSNGISCNGRIYCRRKRKFLDLLSSAMSIERLTPQRIS